MSRVFGVWHGGIGYGLGRMFDDMESWPTKGAAKRALVGRLEPGGSPHDDFARKVLFDESGTASVGEEVGAIIYPLVDRESCYLDVYGCERRGRKWALSGEPIERWIVGPRLGVQVESY